MRRGRKRIHGGETLRIHEHRLPIFPLRGELSEARVFERDVVVLVEVVEPHDPLATGEETLRRVIEAAGMSAHCDFIEQAQAGDSKPDLIVRLPGDKFRIDVTEEIPAVRDTNGEIDVDKTTQAINDVIEGWVREHPAQWLWVHRKWRND